ncbi:MAG: PEGA domain-containing protein [Deltaproteobacteria bacterium]|nr:PEGA domain-containing protein [Deltaproteobacteria bacterium]
MKPDWLPTVLGLSLAACALAPSTSAHADDEDGRGAYVIAIASDDAVRPVVGRVGAAARRALRRHPGVDHAAADEAYLGITQLLRQRLAEAASLLESGRQSYENVELADAVTALSASVEAFEGAGGALEDPSALGDALLFLGAAQALGDQQSESRRTFGRLHVLQPGRRPDPNVFPPDIVTRFDRAAPRDLRSPSASIEVRSEPDGAEVFVDGVARGTTPMTVHGLVAGSHIVRVVLPGHSPHLEIANVRGGATTSVTAMLGPTRAADAISAAVGRLSEGGSLETALRSLGRTLSADLLVVLAVSGQPGDLAIEGSAYETSSGRRLAHQSATASGTPADIDGAIEELTEGLTTEGLGALGSARPLERVGPRRQPRPRPERREPERDGPAIYERWWFWTAVGVVAVGTTIGIVAAASGGDDRTPGLDQQGQIVLEF